MRRWTYKVHVGCQVPTESYRTDLGGVRDCQGLENTPRNARKDVSDQQDLHALSSEQDGRESSNEGETCQYCPAIANPLGNVSIDEETNYLTNLRAVLKAGLPGRRNLPSSIRKLLAILFLEPGKVVEVWKEADVETFHGDTCADEDAPTNGLRIESDALNQGHAMFLFGGGFGTSDQDTVRARMAWRGWVLLLLCYHRRMNGLFGKPTEMEVDGKNRYLSWKKF